MTGDLNIAVAEFGGLDAADNAVESEPARDLAQSVYASLGSEFESVTQSSQLAGFDVQVRSLSQTGRILGPTPAARARIAEDLARRFSADVIIYGNVKSRGDVTSFLPEFYLSDRKLQNAEELIGQHQFGPELETRGDLVTNPVTRRALRERVLARMRVLAQFIFGLGYYAVDRLDEADAYFKAAEHDKGWVDCPCKEVLYLFLGNTAGQRGDLSSAQAYYTQALEFNPNYARAQLGAAEVLFHNSRGACEAGMVDVARLQSAIRGYQSALDATDQPAKSDVPTKVAFGLGRTYLCLSQALHADYWNDARIQFRRVVADFEDGNDRVRTMAAEAHAGLGLASLPTLAEPDADAKYRQSADEFTKAIELMPSPDKRAVYNGMLVHIYVRLQELERAEAAFDEAVRLAPSKRQHFEQIRSQAMSNST